MSSDPLAAALTCRLAEVVATADALRVLAAEAPVLPAARLLVDLDACAALLGRHLDDLSTRRHDRAAHGQPTVASTQN